jgi:hypothetical protein
MHPLLKAGDVAFFEPSVAPISRGDLVILKGAKGLMVHQFTGEKYKGWKNKHDDDLLHGSFHPVGKVTEVGLILGDQLVIVPAAKITKDRFIVFLSRMNNANNLTHRLASVLLHGYLALKRILFARAHGR